MVKAITDPKRSSIDTKQNGAIELSEHYSHIAPAVLADADNRPLGSRRQIWWAKFRAFDRGPRGRASRAPMEHNGSGA
jgi:hypothetical protein